jgi:LysR family glycine cleavage system transcriptional activator
MARQLPPLNALRAFDVAARTGNFTEAARQMRVSQGAVSRHIALLEAYLGTKLFHRQRREVTLTKAGSQYAGLIEQSFDSIERATRPYLTDKQSRPVRIRLFPTFAVKWLVSRLGHFHALHPAINVQVTTTSELVDLDSDDVDFTIQIPAAPKHGIAYEALFPIELIPVCSPAYLRGMPKLRSPRDLLKQTLLHSMKRPGDWRMWFERADVTPGPFREELQFGNSSLAYQAAIDGAGIAMAHTELVQDDLSSGRLVTTHALTVRTDESYHLASRHSGGGPAAEAFRAWILSQAASRSLEHGRRKSK